MAQMTAKDVVDKYNRALEAKDFAEASRFLADDLRFEGPIDRFETADDYVAAITRLYGMVKGVVHQATIVEGKGSGRGVVHGSERQDRPVACLHRRQTVFGPAPLMLM